MMTVRVVDRTTGAPVTGATVTATRVRTRAVVNPTTTMGTPGDYFIVEDGGLPGVPAAGEPIRIEVSAGARRGTVTATLGVDASGCHLEWRGGIPTIRL